MKSEIKVGSILKVNDNVWNLNVPFFCKVIKLPDNCNKAVIKMLSKHSRPVIVSIIGDEMFVKLRYRDHFPYKFLGKYQVLDEMQFRLIHDEDEDEYLF